MTGRPAMGTQVRRTVVAQIGAEAATHIPPLAYRVLMMVVIAILTESGIHAVCIALRIIFP